MPGPAPAGPLQRPLLIESSTVDVDTAAHVDPVQGTPTPPEADSPRHDVCNPDARDLQQADTTRGGIRSTTTCVHTRPVNGTTVRQRVGELLEIYAEALQTKPLRTKCVTSAVLGALGDVLAQGMLWAQGGDALWGNTNVGGKIKAVAERRVVKHYMIQCPHHVTPRKQRAPGWVASTK